MTAYRVVEPSGSNGSIQFAVDGDFSSNTGLVFITESESLGVGTSEPGARLHVSGSTILDAGAGGLHQITGSAVFVTGLTGSLTQIPGGAPYLIAGANVEISTGSNGQITISASGAGYASSSKVVKMSWMETPTGTVDGLNMIFTLDHAPTPQPSLMLYVNGVLQSEGMAKDYVLSDNTITAVSAPLDNSRITATYSYVTDPEAGSNIAWMEEPEGSVDGSNSLFTLSNTPLPSGALMLYYNGVLQRQGPSGDYVIIGDRNIVTVFTPAVGSNIKAVYPH